MTFISGCINDNLDVLSDPVANAGANVSCPIGEICTLDGSGSQGTGGVNYDWSITDNSCTAGSWTGANTVSPSFIPGSAGDCIISLKVTDANGYESTDTVLMREYVQPVADAGPDQTITTGTGTTMTLDGSGSSGIVPLSYIWSITANACGGTLSDNSIANPVLTATTIGICTVELIVNYGNPGTDSISNSMNATWTP